MMSGAGTLSVALVNLSDGAPDTPLATATCGTATWVAGGTAGAAATAGAAGTAAGAVGATPGALEPMLATLERKGRVRKLPAGSGCGHACGKCDPTTQAVYEWTGDPPTG